MSFPVDKIRKDFPVLGQLNRGKPLVYLDNAATTQRPISVVEATSSFYLESNANVHRGIYELGEKATQIYEESRIRVAKFINAEPSSIIFTKGTTDSINLVANGWGRKFLKKGDEILISEMEHHSNIVPWQLIASSVGAVIKYIPLRVDGNLDLQNFKKYVSDSTRILAITQQSNALGTINDLSEIIEYCRSKNIVTLIDGAQSVPHKQTDVQSLGCDFLAFSGHKMLGPTGVGILYGRKDILEEMDPYQGGGEMISTVDLTQSTWAEVPHKFEAGTPNIAGIAGLSAAIDYLENIGMAKIDAYLHEIGSYVYDKMNALDFVSVYGASSPRSSVLSFGVKNVHPHDLSQFLDEDGIAVRAGHHCAQPVMKFLDVPATARASFYIYNTRDEADKLFESVKRIYKFFN